ncbi:hypothetical protein PG997_006586 [Apiospora hydei]|uniref:Uncharacterized protein n=1 Tax=Apiospora hydei TaxID=1337664 RepID=A0ABR1WP51_9PEZI
MFSPTCSRRPLRSPLISTLLTDNEGLDYLTKLQAQVNWAEQLEETVFAVFFHSLVKAHKKWEKDVGRSKELLLSEASKTAKEIVEFLNTIGNNKWEGLDSEVQFLNFVDLEEW